MESQSLRIGLDLGGTKIEIIALDASGAVLLRRRVPTPRHDYAASLQVIGELVEGVERELATSASVGVAIPGAVSPVSGLIKNANSVWLNGKPLQQDLQHILNRPIRLANDANCFALSESVDGAAAGAAVVFAVIIGTGTGGGIVVNGAPLVGPNAIAGEWGHNPLPWPMAEELPGPNCYCGKRGCIETYLSGPGMAADYRRQTRQVLTAEQIAAHAQAGDPQAEQCMRRYESRMARGLASVINLLDPEVIVLGGGLSKIERLYREVPRLWSSYVFSDSVTTRLLAPKFGDSSGVRGAAWLWSS